MLHRENACFHAIVKKVKKMSPKFAIMTFLLQNFAILKYDVFLSQKFANARSALALRDIWRLPLARQLIAAWSRIEIMLQFLAHLSSLSASVTGSIGWDLCNINNAVSCYSRDLPQHWERRGDRRSAGLGLSIKSLKLVTCIINSTGEAN